MTDKPTKRRAVWGHHTTPAEASEAAKTHAAEETAMLRAEVVRLTNERDTLKQDAIEAHDTITILRAQLTIWRRFAEGHILNDAAQHNAYWRGKLDVIKDVERARSEEAKKNE